MIYRRAADGQPQPLGGVFEFGYDFVAVGHQPNFSECRPQSFSCSGRFVPQCSL